MTLFRQFFMAHLKGLLIWMAVGALLALAGTSSAKVFVENEMLAAMPPSLMAMYGDLAGMSLVDAYVTILIGKGTYMVPALYAVLLALSIVTREVDRRTIEFLLALPVQRTQVLLARTAVMVVNLSALVATIWALMWYGMESQGYHATWGHVGMAFVNVWLLAVAFGAITLASSMWIDDYSVGVKLFLGIVVLAFLMEYVLRSAVISRAGRLLSPFSYVDISRVIRSGSIAATDAIVLVAAIALGLGISFWAINRKQFSA